jgi:hypothetical protein
MNVGLLCETFSEIVYFLFFDSTCKMIHTGLLVHSGVVKFRLFIIAE